MKNKKALWITQTAMLIALIVLSQLLSKVIPPIFVGPFNLSQLVTGSLVNLVLVVGACVSGFSAATTAALISPVLAAFFGIIPGGLPQMVPVVMAGNVAIVLIIWICFRASNGLYKRGAVLLNIFGVAAGAFVKMAVMWSATVKIIVPLFKVAPKLEKILVATVSAPQFVTAVIGGLIAMAIVPAMKPFSKKKR
jgi:hypothetical protein